MPETSYLPDPKGTFTASREFACDCGGGSGSVFSGHYGGGTPTQTPTSTSAIAYDLDAPFSVWNWDGSAWF